MSLSSAFAKNTLSLYGEYYPPILVDIALNEKQVSSNETTPAVSINHLLQPKQNLHRLLRPKQHSFRVFKHLLDLIKETD